MNNQRLIIIWSVVNLFATVACICFLLLGKQQPAVPDSINYELYKYRLQELEGQLDSLESQFKTTQNEIIKDSVFVVTADRGTRDSLRARINPR